MHWSSALRRCDGGGGLGCQYQHRSGLTRVIVDHACKHVSLQNICGGKNMRYTAVMDQ